MAVNDTKKNSGFTLVELLIAMTILAIIVIPLLHAFISSARTNNKAYMTMRATSIAENIMEEFEDAKVTDLEKKYSVTQAADGSYLFDFDASKLSEYGTDRFTAKVLLDPNTVYQAENVKAMIDISTISGANNAVYVMGKKYDESIYDVFEEKSEAAEQMDNSVYHKKDAAWFKKELHRTILVDIKKGSMLTDEDGNTFPAVQVSAEITYEYRSNSSEKVLLDSDTRYSVKKDLFDNTTVKKPLNGIYIMYAPRYEACLNGGKTDEMIVRNEGNVEANLYVICQETTEDASKRNSYYTLNKAALTVYEKPPLTGGLGAGTKGALKFRTNLYTVVSPMSDEVKLSLDLKYSNTSAAVGTLTAEKILQAKRPDGKALDGKATKGRIYTMKVSVCRVSETQPLVTLEGTKID